MISTDSANIPNTNHVATILDDLITWRTIGSKQTGRQFLKFKMGYLVS